MESQAVALEHYRGHRFTAEAVARGNAWLGRYQVDFMPQPAFEHTLGPRAAATLDQSWATPAEAAHHAIEQAHAAIDAYVRLLDGAAAEADSGLRDQRLTLCYSLLADDGVEKQRPVSSTAEAAQIIRSLGTGLRHAFVLDSAGTTVLEAGIDDRVERERPNHADWPQTE